MANPIRNIISGNRNRLKDGGYNLDLVCEYPFFLTFRLSFYYGENRELHGSPIINLGNWTDLTPSLYLRLRVQYNSSQKTHPKTPPLEPIWSQFLKEQEESSYKLAKRTALPIGLTL